jgi:capsular polysaccharide biosynthesis protein
MAEQVMDVRSAAAFLRQRWRSLAAMGAVGVALGVLYVALVPAPLGSTTLLLFPRASGVPGESEEETLTQVHIVRSTPVLEKAGRSVKPVLSAAEVKQRIKVAARTSNLIEIQALSRSAPQARALSQAVAEAYITTLQDNASSSTAASPELRSRETSLKKQLKAVQTEIDATKERLQGEDARSSAGLRDAELLSQLTVQQSDLSVRLDKVREAAVETPDGASETPSIIQPAAPATGPSLIGRLLTWTIAGALLAVAGTALVLLIRRRRDPRVRARDDLADAVGSRLLAVVRSHPQRSVAGWLVLFETYEPSAEEAWAFRQVLRALVGPADSPDPARTGTKRTQGRVEHPRSLTVIALSGDQRGAAVGPQLAAFAASLGITTRFTIATRHDSAASLFAASALDRGSELRPGLVLEAGTDGATPGQDASPRPMDDALKRPSNGGGARESRLQEALGPYSVVPMPHGTKETDRHETPPATEPHEIRTRRSVDLTIVFAVADRREPTLREVPATAVTVLAISPGVGTREELARLAVAVDDAGRRIDGVVVADPEPSDRTTGRRTLDERALQAPLPVRLTGPSQVSMSRTGRRKGR